MSLINNLKSISAYDDIVLKFLMPRIMIYSCTYPFFMYSDFMKSNNVSIDNSTMVNVLTINYKMDRKQFTCTTTNKDLGSSL